MQQRQLKYLPRAQHEAREPPAPTSNRKEDFIILLPLFPTPRALRFVSIYSTLESVTKSTLERHLSNRKMLFAPY